MTDKKYEEFLKQFHAQEAKDRERERSRVVRKCERTKEIKSGINVNPENKKHCKKTAPTKCFTCRNSCPNPKEGLGCEWSMFLIPVPGWDAERSDLLNSVRGGDPVESYHVRECPKYIAD